MENHESMVTVELTLTLVVDSSEQSGGSHWGYFMQSTMTALNLKDMATGWAPLIFKGALVDTNGDCMDCGSILN